MKNVFAFKTLTEFTDYFCDEEVCRKHFAAIRFRDGEFCVHCGHKEIYSFNDGRRYRCAKCKQDFTIKNGTIFGDSKLPLRKWFIAIYLLFNSGKGISSHQLAKHVGVTQRTAWFMDHRLRQAAEQSKGLLFGTVEVDETYIGQRSRTMHAKKRRASGVGTGGVGKTILFGMKSRNGEVRAKIIKAINSRTLHPIIKENVAPGATVYSDEHRAYKGLDNHYTRSIIRHGLQEFKQGDCHTNGIESFWALFKRGYHGVYHHMSPKHLPRYVNEFCFRANRSQKEPKAVFQEVLTTAAGTEHLTYDELTQRKSL